MNVPTFCWKSTFEMLERFLNTDTYRLMQRKFKKTSGFNDRGTKSQEFVF